MWDRAEQVFRLVLFCGVLAWSPGARAAIETAVTLSPARAVAGGSVTVSIYHTNPADSAQALRVPQHLDCLLQTGEGAVVGRLERAASSAPPEGVLSPGAFRKAVYGLRLPDGVSGTVIVELVGLVANPAVLQITALSSPDTAASSSAASGDHEEEPAAQENEGGGDSAGADLLSNFATNEPMYFIVGGKGDGAKFQLGFKYRFFNPRGPLARRWTWLDDLYLAYTQTSIWDIYEESSPFRDTNYKPELIYHKQASPTAWNSRPITAWAPPARARSSSISAIRCGSSSSATWISTSTASSSTAMERACSATTARIRPSAWGSGSRAEPARLSPEVLGRLEAEDLSA